MSLAARDDEGGWRAEALVVLALVAVAVIPRVLHLSADPPQDLHEHWLTDEAWWAHNARLHALFGRWSIDDHNPPLYGAPLYTWVLRGVYALLGTGLWPTRMLAAASGALTCLLFYGALRLRHPRRAALPPALLLTLGYFMLSYNRVGLVESFQLLLATGALLAVWLAATRPAWGPAGGVLLVLAMLSKPTAIAVVPAVPLFWWLHARFARRDPALPPFRWRGPLGFIAGAAVAGLLVAGLWFWPNRHAVLAQMAVSRTVTFMDNGSPRVSLLGLPYLNLRRGGFWLQTLVPLTLVALVLQARATGRHPQRLTLAELLGWAWLASGLLVLLPQLYQVDRRFLILAPAVALIAGGALQPEGMQLPGRAETRAGRAWTAVAGLGLGGLAGLVLLPWLGRLVQGVAGTLGHPPLAASRAETLAWHAAAGVGLLAGWAWARWGPAMPRRLPVALLAFAFLATEPLRLAPLLVRPTYTIAATSDSLAAFTRDWPAERKVIVGLTADAFAANTDLFPFVIRIRSYGELNADGWDRFHPSLAVFLEHTGQARRDVTFAALAEAEARGFRRWRRFPIWPDAQGQPRYEAFFVVDSALCPACAPLQGPRDER